MVGMGGISRGILQVWRKGASNLTRGRSWMNVLLKKMLTDGKFGKLYIIDLGARSNIVPSHKLLLNSLWEWACRGLGMSSNKFGVVQGNSEFKCPMKWVFPKIVHFNWVFHYFHHPFWGFSPYVWKHPTIVHLKVFYYIKSVSMAPLKRRRLLLMNVSYVFVWNTLLLVLPQDVRNKDEFSLYLNKAEPAMPAVFAKLLDWWCFFFQM